MQISTPRILVVDDEPNVLMTVQAILGGEGFEVDGCSGGASAIAAIRDHHFDLVLTDLKMPDVDGLAVLAQVRKLSPDTVTVMMTGFGSVDSTINALQLGAYEYLLKPVEVPELKAAVRRALERKRLSEIDTLYGISQTLTNSLDRSVISAEVCAAVTRVLGLADCRLLTFERDQSILECGGAISATGDQELHSAFRDRELNAMLARGDIITVENAVEPLRKWSLLAGVKSFALLPGITAGRLVCVLCADNGPEAFDFHASALRFLRSLAGQTAITLENASLVAELKRNNLEITSANKKLRELDKLKSQFLAVATHELRTPLTLILGYNSMLSESLADRLTEDDRKTLQESMSACRRLIGLVNSMLDISQIESGKMRMNFGPANLWEIITGVVSLFHYEAERKKITLRVTAPDNLPTVRIDAERIQQALVNLIANALKFTDMGGSVDIAAQFLTETEEIEISVRDTGIGIAPEHHVSIFDEFSQIQCHNAERHRKGSGLGLAIAQRIVKAHQGTIRVHSSLGQGSTFLVTLPLKSRPSIVRTAMSA
jgi:two-component system, OmpR family, phosphate regulon sensor histidine kinase PhoR